MQALVWSLTLKTRTLVFLEVKGSIACMYVWVKPNGVEWSIMQIGSQYYVVWGKGYVGMIIATKGIDGNKLDSLWQNHLFSPTIAPSGHFLFTGS